MSDPTSSRRRGLVLVLAATFLWSLAGLFTRLTPHLDFGAVLCGRAGFGGLFGLLLAARDWRKAKFEARSLVTPLAPLVVLLSATAISSYIVALMTTTVADVMVIYATLPFVAAGLALLALEEWPTRHTMIASGLALVGIVVMVAGGLGEGRLLGQAISFLMTATFAMLVVLQRRFSRLPVAPINALGALVASGFGFVMTKSMAMSLADLGVLFLFGLSTITFGFALFMEGAKYLPASEASLIAMLDVVLGPLWVLIAFGEIPDRATLIGGAFVLGAVLWRLAPELHGEVEPIAPTGPTL